MPNTILRRSALNIPLLALWVVAVGVLALGFWMLQAGNAAQAEFYTSGGDNYLEYLNLQTQSTIGGFLLVAGVFGLLLALATHARNRAAAALAAGAAPTNDERLDASDDFDDDVVDDDEAAEPSEPDASADSEAEAEPATADAGDASAEPETTPEPARA